MPCTHTHTDNNKKYRSILIIISCWCLLLHPCMVFVRATTHTYTHTHISHLLAGGKKSLGLATGRSNTHTHIFASSLGARGGGKAASHIATGRIFAFLPLHFSNQYHTERRNLHTQISRRRTQRRSVTTMASMGSKTVGHTRMYTHTHTHTLTQIKPLLCQDAHPSFENKQTHARTHTHTHTHTHTDQARPLSDARK